MKGRNNTPRTRQAKRNAGEERAIQPKHQEQREESIDRKPLVAMNSKQAAYMTAIQHGAECIIATGYPGTSKTYIATMMACDMYRRGAIDQIALTRPACSNSQTVGYFKGTVEEKMAQWLGPVLTIIKQRLGAGAYECAIAAGDIQFVPFEVIKGWSFKRVFVICDEAEDITVAEAKKFVTRQGKGSVVVLAGDVTQSEFGGESGLAKLVQLLDTNPELRNHVTHIDFDELDDIVRSDICREWTLAFIKDEQGR